ncbi:hypothetical protein WR25_17265 [Diploscapter pachys]|uniref:Uncharacterized protein n=1 Tax=Diploscapter pachys TaxID=2018661 RepID=A0A2A2K0V7_9BILA|nr:hypothetical protein WR25_17265 [Diploscapter pachys]
MQADGLRQRVPVPREVQRDDRKGHVRARLQRHRRHRRCASARRVVRQNRAVHALADRDGHVRRVFHPDRLGPRLEPLPDVVVAIGLRVVRVQVQDEQVFLIDVRVGAPERIMIGVTLHDAGHTRAAGADHVEPRRGQVRDVARRKAADAEMGIVGQDRATGCGAVRGDRPRIAAMRVAVEPIVDGIVACLHRRVPWQRPIGQRENAEVGVGHRRHVEPVGHHGLPIPGEGRHQPVEIEQPARRKPGAAHLVVGPAHVAAADAYQIGDIPAERGQPQRSIFGREQCGVRLQFRNPGIDPVHVSARARHNIRRQGVELCRDIAPEQQQAGGVIIGHEPRPEAFRQPPKVAAQLQIDLEQSIAGDDIALPEIGVGDRPRPDMGHAPYVVGDRHRTTCCRTAHSGDADRDPAAASPGGAMAARARLEADADPEGAAKQIRIGAVRRQPGFRQQDRIAVEQIGNVEEQLRAAAAVRFDLGRQIEVEIDDAGDRIVVDRRELRDGGGGAARRAIAVADDIRIAIGAAADPTRGAGHREAVRLIAGIEAIDPLGRADAAQLADGVDRYHVRHAAVGDVVDVARREAMQRDRARRALDDVGERQAVACVEVDAADPLAGEVERAGAEEQLAIARGIGAIGGAEFGPPLKAAVDDVLREELADRVLQLDVEPVDRRREARQEGGLEHHADGDGVRLFGAQVRVSGGRLAEGDRRAPRRRIGQRVGA